MMLEQIGDLKNRKSVEKNSSLSVGNNDLILERQRRRMNSLAVCAAAGYAYKLEQDSIRNAVLPVSIKMYPNPTDEYVILEMSKVYAYDLDVQVYNMLGEEVFASTLPAASRLTKLNTTVLSTGIYRLIVKDSIKTIFSHSLVISN